MVSAQELDVFFFVFFFGLPLERWFTNMHVVQFKTVLFLYLVASVVRYFFLFHFSLSYTKGFD